MEIKSLDRQLGKFSCENKLLKEELSECLTSMTKLKDSNYKFNHQVEDLRKSNEGKNYSSFCSNCIFNVGVFVAGFIQKIRELETALQEKNIYYKEREMKSEATISQQIKLIDYLQLKVFCFSILNDESIQ